MVKPDYSLVDVDGYLDAERKNVSNQNLEPKARTASIISSYGCPVRQGLSAEEKLRTAQWKMYWMK